MIIEAKSISPVQKPVAERITDPNTKRVGVLFDALHKAGSKIGKVIFQAVPRSMVLQPQPIGGIGKSGIDIVLPLKDTIVLFGKNKNNNNKQIAPRGSGRHYVPNEAVRQQVRENGHPVHKRVRKGWWRRLLGR